MRLTAFAAAWIMSLCLLSFPAASAQTIPTRTLSVIGTGEVHVVPDTAIVTVGVASDADTASAALRTSSAAISKMLDSIHSSGIDAKDVKTSSLSLEPRYYHPRSSGPDRSRVIGYTAINNLTIRVRDLTKLGNLLDSATAAGANRIEGIRFLVAHQQGLLDQARKQAIKNAKDKADLYAREAGFSLGRIQSLTEEGVSGPIAPMAMARISSVPIQSGEVTLSARVHVVWEITY